MNMRTLDSAFLWGIKTEVDACRRQVETLTTGLNTQRIEFGRYRQSTEAKLSELKRDKEALTREVIALRGRQNGAQDEASVAATATGNVISDSNREDQNNTSPAGIETESFDDSKLVIVPSNTGERDTKVESEEPKSDEAEFTTPGRASPASKPEPRKKKRAISKNRVMEQRMFLLRHACKCTAPEGTCRVSRHCAETRAVWNHIVNDGCDDPKCSVPHCVSSRYVMKNYHRYVPTRSRGVVCRVVKQQRDAVRMGSV